MRLRLWDDDLEGLRAEVRALLPLVAQYAALGDADLPEEPVARARVMRDVLASFLPATGSAMAREITVPGPGGDVPVRLFEPERPRGLFLHLHGGGWATGAPMMNDQSNEQLAKRHGLVVASVDYRLAPEHPYPAAPDDCEAVASWLLAEGTGRWGVDRLLLGGESAGAHLALVTLLRIRDRLGAVGRVLGVNLVYGVYDLRGTPSSFNNGGHVDMLSPEGLRWYTEAFTPAMTDEERRHPDVSPLFADLAGLPHALVTVGGADHLRDDSLFLAARWAAAESPCELIVYPDSPHGFQALPTAMTGEAAEHLDRWIAQRLDGTP
jgi:acetyl esterase